MNHTPGSSTDPVPAPAPKRPVWRDDGPRFALVAWVIATIALAVTAAGVAVIVSVFATVRAAVGGERSGEELGKIAQAAIASEAFTWTAVIASQLALLACAWLACRVLKKPAHERLGLVATQLRHVQKAVLLIATVVPFALGLAAASLVSTAIGASSDDPSGLQRMWSEGSRAASVAWILLIALLPGFVEELFYRGFLQRGLLLRWGPAASILTSSLLFAVVHGDPASAAAIFPLGVWLGFVAWRTGSMLMTFAMHASLNGLWTAGMMILHRDPTSEPVLNGIAVALLALSAIAFPWAIAILRREPAVATSALATNAVATNGATTNGATTNGATTNGATAKAVATSAVATRLVERRSLWLLPRVAGAAVVAGALFFVFVPPGAAPIAAEQVAVRPAPTLGELEASAIELATCTAAGDEGAVEFSLMPGVGARVALPKNRVGIDEVIVTLDSLGEIVWLAYAGERSGKGSKRRPVGIVEQLAAGDPTVLCMTLTEGPPPVTVRLTIEHEEEMKLAAFEQARAEGWALRGR